MTDTVKANGKTYDYAPGVKMRSAAYEYGQSSLTLEFIGWTVEDLLRGGIIVPRKLCPAAKTMVNIADMRDGIELRCDKKAGHPGKVHVTEGGFEFQGGL